MENASKALVIAGAVLLVIALIAVGVSILNRGNMVTNNVAENMTNLEVQAWNRKLLPYIGIPLTANKYEELRTLCASMGMRELGTTAPRPDIKLTFEYDALTNSGEYTIEAKVTQYISREHVDRGITLYTDPNVVFKDKDIGKINKIAIERYNKDGSLVGSPKLLAYLTNITI